VSNKPIITIDNIGKSYLVRHKSGIRGNETLRDTLTEVARKTLTRRRTQKASSSNAHSTVVGAGRTSERFWALRHVSFDINEGDLVGIIGRNGAGKSTLLKILSRITAPTEGQVRLRGRVASLLEVGTGFHPELTGRENIFLNGAILGMSRSEVRSKFDEIVQFAEIERFLDTPVKRYSSGMYVRLAFAVAAHLEPEILLVDEVLAVGDIQFQKKCLGKMSSVAGEGRTVLFVSHNMSAIRSLCSKCVLLNGGELELYDNVGKVTSKYLNAYNTNLREVAVCAEKPDLPCQINSVKILSSQGQVTPNLPHDKPFKIEVEVSIRKKLPDWYLALHILDEESGIVVFDRMLSSLESSCRNWGSGTKKVFATIPGPLIVPGRYYVTVHLSLLNPPEKIDGAEAVCSFEIFDNGSANARAGLPWHGKISTPIQWIIEGDR